MTWPKRRKTKTKCICELTESQIRDNFWRRSVIAKVGSITSMGMNRSWKMNKHAPRFDYRFSARQSFRSVSWRNSQMRPVRDSSYRYRSTSRACCSISRTAPTSETKWTTNYKNVYRKERMDLKTVQIQETASTNKCRKTSLARSRLSSTCELTNEASMSSDNWVGSRMRERKRESSLRNYKSPKTSYKSIAATKDATETTLIKVQIDYRKRARELNWY